MQRSRIQARVCAGCLALALPLVAVPASAAVHVDPSEDDLERAKSLYQRAKARFDKGEFVEAAGLFVSAYELSGEPNLLYNASYAFERAYEYENALLYLRKYQLVAPQEDRQGLDEEIAQLEARYEAAKRDDHLDAEKVGAANTSAQPVADDQGPKKRIFGPGAAILTATSILGVGMTVGFGVAALNRRNSIENSCAPGGPEGTLCPDTVERQERERKVFAALADTGIAIAAVSVVALTTVLLVNRRRATKQSAFRVAPAAGVASAGVWMTGKF